MAEYTRRWPVWHNLPTQDTPIDATFLEGVEVALVKLLGVDTPSVDEVGVWTPGSGGLIYQKIGANQIAAGAIDNSKIAAAAAIARSKLDFGSGLVNADMAAGMALALSKLAGYPSDGTKFPAGDGTWKTISSTIPVVTSLPGSPADGDEVILTDSATAGTYYWHLRYRATSTNADKWEFVGGAPGYAQVLTAESTSSTTYTALTTAGPSFTLPRVGVYNVFIGAYVVLTGGATGGYNPWMSYDIGGTGAVDADAARQGGVNSHFSRLQQKSFASAVTLVAKYRMTTAAGDTIQFSDRWMQVTPVRLS